MSTAELHAVPTTDSSALRPRRASRARTDSGSRSRARGRRRATATAPIAGRKTSAWFFPAVDGLRGLAIASVLLFHTNWSPRGIFGVDVFFAVSGFLITLLLLRELGATGRLRIGTFFKRRVKRLVPGLLITLGLVLGAAWLFAGTAELQAIGARSLAAVLQIANWEQLYAGTAYWDATGAIQPLAHMWSLSVTEQFYIVWPFLLLLIWWLTRKSPLWLAVGLGVLTLGSALVAPLMWDGSNSDRLYLGTDSRAVTFIAGAAIAAIVYWLTQRRLERGEEPVVTRLRTILMTTLSAVLLGTVLTASIMTTSYHEAWLYQGGLAAVGIAASGFIATLCSPNNLLVRFFAFSLFRAFGKVAYSVFLLHLPVFWMLQTITPGIAPLTLFFVGGGLTWLLAAFIHHGITERMRKASWRPTRGIPALITGIGIVVAAAVALPGMRLAETESITAAPRPEGALVIPNGAAGGRPVVLTVGDSIGNDFAGALRDAGTDGFAVRDGASGGCALLRSEMIRMEDGSTGDTASCDDWRTDWPETLAQLQPDVVIMHTYWDALDQYVDGSWISPGDERYDATYSAILDEAAAIVSANAPHAKLVVVNDRLTTGLISDPKRSAAFESLLDDFIERHENASLLDLKSELCTGAQCVSKTSTGAPIFLPDNVHFTPQGKAFLAPWLEQHLADLLA